MVEKKINRVIVCGVVLLLLTGCQLAAGEIGTLETELTEDVSESEKINTEHESNIDDTTNDNDSEKDTALESESKLEVNPSESEPTEDNPVDSEPTEEPGDMEIEDTTSETESEDSEINTETEEPKEPEDKDSWSVTDMNKTMYAKSAVNIRKGPGTSYDKVGSLSKNDEVLVTGKCNEFNWYRIQYNNREAYVSANYLVNNKSVDVEMPEDSSTEDNPNNEEELDSEIIIGPEPEWGTIIYELPEDGWNYMPVHVKDIWIDKEKIWARSVRQSTFGNKEQDDYEVYEITKKAYPLRTDIGEEGMEIEYPTIWIYFGDGRY